jgi:hypothetical protein
MARDYARIMTAIWDNEEFCKLDEACQRAYLLLVTQPDISAAGVLRLWVPRWVEMSRSSTTESLTAALKELEANRFIVMDWRTGELLVRSFVRWDAGFNNPKRKPVIVRAGKEVRSEAIKEHLRVEFKRCGLLPDPPPTPNGPHRDSPSDTHADSLSGSQSKINRVDPGPDPFPQVDSLSASDALSDGVVVTYVSTKDTATHNPQPVPPAAGAEPSPGETTAQTLVAEWIEQCRKRPPGATIGQTSKAIKAMLEEGIDPDDIRGGITAWTAKGLHPSALPAVVNEHMNATPIANWQRRNSPPAASTTEQWQAMKDTGTEPLRLRALTGGDRPC